jgi:hypothetical protein
VINPSNRELMIDELEAVNGGKPDTCCNPRTGPDARTLGGLGEQILLDLKSVVKTIAGILGF